MSVEIQVDIQQARADVQALNSDIMAIATSAASVKSAFGGDFMAGFMASLQSTNAAAATLTQTVGSLNQALGLTNQAMQSYTGTAQANVQAAQQQSQAILGTVTSLQSQSAMTKQVIGDVERLTAAEARAAMRWTSQEGVLRATTTAMQMKAAVTRELADMEEKGMITARDTARYQEIMAQTYRNTGTAAEVMLASLRQQNAVFNQSEESLRRMTDGWSTLSAAQQQSLRVNQQTASDIALVGKHYTDTASIMGTYQRELEAINRLHTAGKTSDDQHAQAIERLNKAFNDQLSAAKNAALAMDKKAYADSQAAVQEKKVQDAINATTNVMTRGIDPVTQYAKRIADLNTALAGASTFGGGRLAISQQQYQQGLVGARQELERNIAAATRARVEMNSLNSQFHVGTQAAAGFRAGLQGAGLGFGIFTSNTIVAATAVYGFAKAIRESLTVGGQFEETFNRAMVMLGNFDLATQKPIMSFAGFQAQVMGLSETTRFSSNEISKALIALGQAGYGAAEAMSALPSVLNLATIGEMSTDDATVRLINTMTAFGIASTDAAMAADKLSKASLVSTTTISELMVGLGQTSAVAYQAGLSFEQTLGALAAMRQAGIQASKTGTDLRNIIQSLANPTSKAAELFNKLNIDTQSFYENGGLNLQKLLTTLKEKLDNLKPSEQTALEMEWFGRRSATGMAALLNTLTDVDHGFIAMTEKIKDASGTAANMAAIINNNAKTAFQQLGHVIENVAITAFQANQTELTASIREFSEYIKANGPQIAQTISSVTSSVVSLTQWLVENGKVIAGLFIAYEGWKVLNATIATITNLSVRTQAAYGAAIMRSNAALVEHNAISGAAVVTGNALNLTTATQAKVFDAQALAAARASFAMSGMAPAAAGAATAMATLRAAGAGLVALLGGWPMLVAGVVVGMAYLADGVMDSMTAVETDVNGAHEAINRLIGARDSLNSMDYSGVQNFIAQIDAGTAKVKEQIAALEHNIALMRQQEVSSFVRYSSAVRGGNWTASDTPGKALAAMQQAREETQKATRDQDELNRKLQESLELRRQAEAISVFKSSEVSAYHAQLNALADSLRSNNTNVIEYAQQIGQFFQDLREEGKLTSVAFSQVQSNFVGILAYMRASAAQREDDRKRRDEEAKAAKEKAARQAAESAAVAESEARIRALSSELGNIVNSYNKAVGAAGEWSTKLREIADVQSALSKGQLTKELEKLGVSAQEASKALDWQVKDLAFDAIKDKLVELNPQFKSLTDGTSDLTKQSTDLADAYALVDKMMAQLLSKASPAQAAAITQMVQTIKDQMPGAVNGVKETMDEFNGLLKNTAGNWNEAFRVEGIDALIAKVKSLGSTIGAEAQQTLESAKVFALLGGNVKAVSAALAQARGPAVTYAQIQEAITSPEVAAALAGIAGGYDTVARALRNIADATPEGKLLKQNENLRNQMAIIAQGGAGLEYYNLLWQQTGGHLEDATALMRQATAEQILLNEQFARMQEVQSTFKSLATSLGDAFGSLFMNARDGWDDFIGDVKTSFKKLLQDLITQAITNQILFYFGFSGSGYGGGGGSLGGLVGLASSFMGLSSGSGGSGGSGGLISSLVGSASANNSAYTGVGGTSSGYFGSGGYSNLVSTGRYGYQAVTGQLNNPFTSYATGRAMPGSSYFGTYSYGPLQNGGTMSAYSPTALGYGTAVASGLYMGYNRYQDRYNTGTGIAAGATYAVGGTALALGVGSMMAGGTFAAGVGAMGTAAGAMGASAGAMAAIPVVGWIALALMAVDMISGGKLFGTSANKFVGGQTTTTITDTGADMSGTYRFKGQKALFGGAYYRNKPMEITDEMQAQADALYRQIHQVAVEATRQLGVSVATGVEGSFKAEFDKKGEITKTISTVLGKTYEESLEEFVQRMQGEQIIAAVDASIMAMGGTAAEATRIADQYRGDAATLLEAAQFMLLAQTDIKNAQGLLRETGAGVFTDTVGITQSLQASGESLTQTYTRLVAETALLDNVFDSFGSSFQRTGTDFVQFADDFVQALGGLDAATTAWNSFTSAIFGATGYITQATSSGRIGAELTGLGLNPAITIEQFAAAFRSVADVLGAEDLANWVQAGANLGTISEALITLQGMANGVDVSSVISQQAQVVQSVNDWINTAARLGASEAQLAEMRELGQQAIRRQLSDFMDGINREISNYEGGDWLFQLQEINTQMRQNIDTARALGASQEDLGRIQQLAAYRTAEVIAQLQQSITSLISQLNGADSSVATDANDAISSGQDLLDSALRDMYGAAQSAVQQISEFLDSLQTGSLSTMDWQGQLNAARTQFDDLVVRAQGGDVDAMAQLTQYAQTYLQHAQDAYGNSVTFGEISEYVTSILRNLQNQFEQIPNPGDPTYSGADGGGTATVVTLTDSDRYNLSLQIAQQLGQLGVALDTSVWDLMDSFGVDIAELAANLNVSLTKIDETFFTNLNILAAALRTSSTDVLEQLGAAPAAIGAYFQVSAEQINAGNLANIATMASTLGISAFDAIRYMGADLMAAIEANGIPIKSLDAASMAALGTIANTLDVDITALLREIGISVETYAGPLVQAIRDSLSAIPDLAEATVLGLEPLLVALGAAVNEGDLNSVLGSINDYIATLPESQATALTDLFAELGVDLNTRAIQEAQRDAQLRIADNTLETNNRLTSINDAINGSGNSLTTSLAGIIENTAILADIYTVLSGNSANGGGSSLPSGYVPGDNGVNSGYGGVGGGSGYVPEGMFAAMPDYIVESLYSAGQQNFESGSDDSVKRSAEASEETVGTVAEMLERMEQMQDAIVSQLSTLNKVQVKAKAGIEQQARTARLRAMTNTVK